MKNYELVCILDPQLGDPGFEGVIENYETFLKSNGADLSYTERWGLRKLAYSSVSLKSRRQGYYVLFQFAAESDLLSPLEQQLKLDEGILRHLITAVKGEFMRMPQLAPESMILGENRPPREAAPSRPSRPPQAPEAKDDADDAAKSPEVETVEAGEKAAAGEDAGADTQEEKPEAS